MARSIRSRVVNAGGDKNIADLLAAGWKYEGQRVVWFSSCGNSAMADECLARQAYFQREWDDMQREAA